MKRKIVSVGAIFIIALLGILNVAAFGQTTYKSCSNTFIDITKPGLDQDFGVLPFILSVDTSADVYEVKYLIDFDYDALPPHYGGDIDYELTVTHENAPHFEVKFKDVDNKCKKDGQWTAIRADAYDNDGEFLKHSSIRQISFKKAKSFNAQIFTFLQQLLSRFPLLERLF
jgi:hypothetical protein